MCVIYSIFSIQQKAQGRTSTQAREKVIKPNAHSTDVTILIWPLQTLSMLYEKLGHKSHFAFINNVC